MPFLPRLRSERPPVAKPKDALASNQCEFSAASYRESRGALLPALRTAAQRRPAVPGLRQRLDVDGPTACRAAVPQGLSEAPGRGNCRRWYRPEVIEAAIPILDRVAARHNFALLWERLPYSADHYLKTKETLPDSALEHLRTMSTRSFSAPWAIRACPATSMRATSSWFAIQARSLRQFPAGRVAARRPHAAAQPALSTSSFFARTRRVRTSARPLLRR